MCRDNNKYIFRPTHSSTLARYVDSVNGCAYYNIHRKNQPNCKRAIDDTDPMMVCISLAFFAIVAIAVDALSKLLGIWNLKFKHFANIFKNQENEIDFAFAKRNFKQLHANPQFR